MLRQGISLNCIWYIWAFFARELTLIPELPCKHSPDLVCAGYSYSVHGPAAMVKAVLLYKQEK